MKCCSIISKEDFGNLTYEKLVKKINEIPTTTIRELRYSDLYQPRNSCHGIYIIKSPDNKYYFGKATGRCVADRIGAHFDSRKGSYMNSLLKKVASDDSDYALQQSYNTIIDWQFGVLFIDGNESEQLRKLIGLAERILIHHHNAIGQSFNSCKCNLASNDPEITLNELL